MWTFSLLNKMHLEGLLVEDQKGDTILYAGDMKVRITDWFIFQNIAELKNMSVLKIPSSNFNGRIQYGGSNSSLISSVLPATVPKKKKRACQIDLKKLELKKCNLPEKGMPGWERICAFLSG